MKIPKETLDLLLSLSADETALQAFFNSRKAKLDNLDEIHVLDFLSENQIRAVLKTLPELKDRNLPGKGLEGFIKKALITGDFPPAIFSKRRDFLETLSTILDDDEILVLASMPDSAISKLRSTYSNAIPSGVKAFFAKAPFSLAILFVALTSLQAELIPMPVGTNGIRPDFGSESSNGLTLIPCSSSSSEVQLAYAKFFELATLFNSLKSQGRPLDAEKVHEELIKASAEVDAAVGLTVSIKGITPRNDEILQQLKEQASFFFPQFVIRFKEKFKNLDFVSRNVIVNIGIFSGGEIFSVEPNWDDEKQKGQNLFFELFRVKFQSTEKLAQNWYKVEFEFKKLKWIST